MKVDNEGETVHPETVPLNDFSAELYKAASTINRENIAYQLQDS